MDVWRGQFPLRARGRWLVNQQGERFKLVGVNWYGASDSLHIVGGLAVQTLEGICQTVKDLGFTVVRLPFSNEMLRAKQVPEGTIDYRLNPGLRGLKPLDVYVRVVDALGEARVAVVINNHTTLGAWSGGPDMNGLWFLEGSEVHTESQWIADWLRIATLLGDRPHVIGYDIRNEVRPSGLMAEVPTWGGGSPLDFAIAAGKCARALVAEPSAPGLIIIERMVWPQDSLEAFLQPKPLWEVWGIPRDRVMLAMHTYSWSGPKKWSPKAFTGHVTYAFLHAADLMLSRALYGEMDPVTWESQMDAEFGNLLDRGDCPVWVSEFGADPSGPQEWAWFLRLVDYLRRKDVDFAYWPLNVGLKPGTSEDEPYGMLTNDWRPRWRDPRYQELRQLLPRNTSAAKMPSPMRSLSTPCASPSPASTTAPSSPTSSDSPSCFMCRSPVRRKQAGPLLPAALMHAPHCSPLPGPLADWPGEDDAMDFFDDTVAGLPPARFLWDIYEGQDTDPGRNAKVCLGNLESLKQQCVTMGHDGFVHHAGVGYMRAASRDELAVRLQCVRSSSVTHLATEVRLCHLWSTFDAEPSADDDVEDLTTKEVSFGESDVHANPDEMAELCRRECLAQGMSGYELRPGGRARLLCREAVVAARGRGRRIRLGSGSTLRHTYGILDCVLVAVEVEAYPEVDAFPGCNARVLWGATLGQCRELCLTEGFEGFAMFGGDAYFRTANATVLKEHLEPLAGCTFYLVRCRELIGTTQGGEELTGLERSDARRLALAQLLPDLWQNPADA